MQDII